ncbi:hypothetical protein Pcinc_032453 [Petrolisthes cinctipes]|nr:hypothetical protein Pcinc_032453 [Petrolisthes cinctipes]
MAFYNHVRENTKHQLELVLVSSDTDQTAFTDHFADMPWHAVPFTDTKRKSLIEMFSQASPPTITSSPLITYLHHPPYIFITHYNIFTTHHTSLPPTTHLYHPPHIFTTHQQQQLPTTTQLHHTSSQPTNQNNHHPPHIFTTHQQEQPPPTTHLHNPPTRTTTTHHTSSQPTNNTCITINSLLYPPPHLYLLVCYQPQLFSI